MATTGRSESRLFVRNSTGLVRSASAVDATIFNAVISAPIGSTLAWSIFFTLVAFPGADPVGVLIIAAIINIPVLIMFALLGASMPRVGGDYVWVSRILNPPLALISNLCMIMGGLLGAAYFAKFFSIFALGPSDAERSGLIPGGRRLETQLDAMPSSRPCHRRPGCLVSGLEDRLWDQEGDGCAGVRGRRDRSRGAAAGAAARGPWPPGDGHDNEPGQVGLAGAAGRRCRRNGRAGCDVGR